MQFHLGGSSTTSSHEVGRESDWYLQKALSPRYIAFYKAVHNTLSFNLRKGKVASAENQAFFLQNVLFHANSWQPPKRPGWGRYKHTMTSRKINRFFFGRIRISIRNYVPFLIAYLLEEIRPENNPFAFNISGSSLQIVLILQAKEFSKMKNSSNLSAVPVRAAS